MSNKKYYHYPHPELVNRAKELRQPLTPAETKLWQRLRGKQLNGLKFRRQHPIHRFIVDFYCPQHQLVIEVDGDTHADPDQQRYDEARTAWLEADGKRVLRFSNRDIGQNIEGVLERIAEACGRENNLG